MNDIFKEGCIGADLKEALLSMFNEMKSSMEVPNIIQWSNITSIYKRSGSKEDMNNQRGIFNLTVLRKIADNLLYNDLHEEIEKGMSDSNIGGRKGRMAKDHLFIVYGIINDVVHGKAEAIDVSSYDIEKAFDKLWMKECFNDLTDTVGKELENNKISLLFKLNINKNAIVDII